MSNRYVWKKQSLTITSRSPDVKSYTTPLAKDAWGKYGAIGILCTDIEEVYDSNGEYIGSKPAGTIQVIDDFTSTSSLNKYPSSSYRYFFPITSVNNRSKEYAVDAFQYSNRYWYIRTTYSDHGTLWLLNINKLPSGYTIDDIDKMTSAEISSSSMVTTFSNYILSQIPDTSKPTTYLSSSNSKAYPTTSGGDILNGYWYEYLGYDNIDPSSVGISYSGKLEPGKSISVNISPRSPTYGGNISYLYQYSVDGGGWESIQTTTAVSVDFTIPETAKKIQFRVRAQDDIGFTSSSYISTSAYVLEHLDLWVGVNGKARKGVAMYVGVNGKARKVTAAYIGVNGKARRFL